MSVSVQENSFDIGELLSGFSDGDQNVGAVVTFSGMVRNDAGTLLHMVIEHYPGMTKPAIEKIEAEAVTRWNLNNSLIVHRHGTLYPGEAIMMVATAAPHRADAFSAAEYLMDYLKSRAPFWKKEVFETGSEWVTAKQIDEDALDRW